METWTPENVREWIYSKLYSLYMQDPNAITRFREETSDEPEPPIKDTTREMKLLEKLDHVKICGETRNSIYAQLTPKGRLYREQPLSPPEQEHEPIGFGT